MREVEDPIISLLAPKVSTSPTATPNKFNAAITSRLTESNTVAVVVRSSPNVNEPAIVVLPEADKTVNLSVPEPFCILKVLDVPFKV